MVNEMKLIISSCCYIQKQLFVLFCLFILHSCTSTQLPEPQKCIKEGKNYCVVEGRMNQEWYLYYERGESCMKGGCFDKAIENFNFAIRKKYEDTYGPLIKYGNNMLRNYFPHREAGISYFMLGQYEKAKKELEISLSAEISSKAYYFWKLTQKKILEKQISQVSAPEIEISQIDEQGMIRTNSDPVIVSGVVHDLLPITDIEINDKKILVERIKYKLPFSQPLKLKHGKHKINVVARNLLGEKSYVQLLLNVDRNGPAIIITQIQSKKGIQGILTDESEVSQFTVNGIKVEIKKAKQVKFTIPLNFNYEHLNIVAKDCLNNKTCAFLSKEIIESKFPLMADASNIQMMHDGKSLLSVAKKNIEIEIYGFKKNNTVYKKNIYIEGGIISKYPVSSLKINDISYKYSGKIVYFSNIIELAEGINTITLTATNIHKQSVKKVISINRKIPEIYSLKQRYALEIIEADNFDQKNLYDTFDQFFIPLLKKEKRFQVLLQPLNHKSEIKHYAKLFLKKLIYETQFGTEIAIELGTGKLNIETVVSQFTSSRGDNALKELAIRLIQKLHNEYPLIQVDISGFNINKTIFFAKTTETSKLKLHWPLLIYNQKEFQNPVTGKSWGIDYYVKGDADIFEIKEQSFTGKLKKSNHPISGKHKYGVILR